MKKLLAALAVIGSLAVVACTTERVLDPMDLCGDEAGGVRSYDPATGNYVCRQEGRTE